MPEHPPKQSCLCRGTPMYAFPLYYIRLPHRALLLHAFLSKEKEVSAAHQGVQGTASFCHITAQLHIWCLACCESGHLHRSSLPQAAPGEVRTDLCPHTPFCRLLFHCLQTQYESQGKYWRGWQICRPPSTTLQSF